MKRILGLLALILAFGAQAWANDPVPLAEEAPPKAIKAEPVIIEGAATALDGDTLWMEGQSIRLFGIDAPEMWRGHAGAESRAELDRWVGKTVRCVVREIDRYKRPVAVCQSNGHDLSETMLRHGGAVTYRRFTAGTDLAARYAAAEDEGRSKGRGLWEKPAERSDGALRAIIIAACIAALGSIGAQLFNGYAIRKRDADLREQERGALTVALISEIRVLTFAFLSRRDSLISLNGGDVVATLTPPLPEAVIFSANTSRIGILGSESAAAAVDFFVLYLQNRAFIDIYVSQGDADAQRRIKTYFDGTIVFGVRALKALGADMVEAFGDYKPPADIGDRYVPPHAATPKTKPSADDTATPET
jgi:succinoglycan biosynthesis protein ExoI